LWIIDLADFDSIKRDGGRLDILIENAALMSNKYEATKDGWESSFVISFNHPSAWADEMIASKSTASPSHSWLYCSFRR
jgi:hypothetical protein